MIIQLNSTGRKRQPNSSQNLEEQGYYLQAMVLSREDSVNETSKLCSPGPHRADYLGWDGLNLTTKR